MRCLQHDVSRWTNDTIETLCEYRQSIERTRVINSSCGLLPHNGVKIPSAALAMYNLNFFFFLVQTKKKKKIVLFIWLACGLSCAVLCQFSHSAVLTGCLLRQHFIIHCTHSHSNSGKVLNGLL